MDQNNKNQITSYSSEQSTDSILTKWALRMLFVCLILYGIAYFITVNTDGLDGLLAIYPLYGAFGLNAILIVFSVMQLGEIIFKRNRLNLKTLVVMIVPILIVGSLWGWQQYEKHKYYSKWQTIESTKTEYINSVSANVYMPKWKNGREVDINTVANKTLAYYLQYAPRQSDNVHRSGEDDYNDTLPNSPEYFKIYIRKSDEEIKKYINPPYNCDVESAIIYAQDKNTKRQPASIPCVVLANNIQGTPIYGQNNWQNNDLNKYAFTVFDGDSLHLISQYGNVEDQIGGELVQFLEWQKDFRRIDIKDVGR